MVDKGIKLTVHTQELTSKDKSELMELHDKLGWFLFSVTEQIGEEDMPNEPIEFEGQKSLSERLYNVLFRLHEVKGGKPENFPSYRAKIMESLINKYKRKISDFQN
jgi:hypothetical protein